MILYNIQHYDFIKYLIILTNLVIKAIYIHVFNFQHNLKSRNKVFDSSGDYIEKYTCIKNVC